MKAYLAIAAAVFALAVLTAVITSHQPPIHPEPAYCAGTELVDGHQVVINCQETPRP